MIDALLLNSTKQWRNPMAISDVRSGFDDRTSSWVSKENLFFSQAASKPILYLFPPTPRGFQQIPLGEFSFYKSQETPITSTI